MALANKKVNAALAAASGASDTATPSASSTSIKNGECRHLNQMGGKIWFIIIIIVGWERLYLYSSGAFVNGIKEFNSLVNTSSTFTFFSLGSSTIAHGPSTPIGPAAPVGTSGSQETSVSAPSSATTPSIPRHSRGIHPRATFAVFPKSAALRRLRRNVVLLRTITLSDNNYNSTGTIDITGWQIKSQDSGEYIRRRSPCTTHPGLRGERYSYEGWRHGVSLFDIRAVQSPAERMHRIRRSRRGLCSGVAAQLSADQPIADRKFYRRMPELYRFSLGLPGARHVELRDSADGLCMPGLFGK